MLGVASLPIAWGLGYLVLDLCGLPARGGPRVRWLRVWLGMGVGFGAASCLQFAWLVLVGESGWGPVAVEGLLLAALVGVRITRRPRGTPGGAAGGAPQASGALERGLRMACALTCVCGAFRLLYVLGLAPHGGWDAFAIWTVRARFLFRAGADWPLAFDAAVVHADYPLLLPGLVLRGWHYARHDTQAVPIAIAIAYAGGTVALLASTLAVLRSRSVAWLGTLTLLLPPFFVSHAATQTADVPMGFYLLATVAALYLYDWDAFATARPLMLAGFLAACAAWTKNEGVLFLGAIAVARVAALVRAGSPRTAGLELGWCALGSVPVLVLAGWFKFRYAPPNDIVTLETVSHAIENVFTFARYRALVAGIGAYAPRIESSVLIAVPLLVLHLATGRNGSRVSRGPALLTATLVLAIMVLGYLMVYVAFSENVLVHVQTSFARLMLQLWPTAVLTYFMWAEPPPLPVSPA